MLPNDEKSVLNLLHKMSGKWLQLRRTIFVIDEKQVFGMKGKKKWLSGECDAGGINEEDADGREE